MVTAIQTKSDTSLYHHGILGMKWGKKNGERLADILDELKVLK